ncbi:hypothetical protein F66182_2060 [Fusarium sp. NRRL 66182]|nr:hypothetical protein F66182_2060 [Fusarium sp. NRRL 66182]
MGYSGGGGDDSGGHGLLTTTLIAVFMGISLYNVVELNVLILSTFKTRQGLYFWSFLVATNGIAPHTIGFMLKNLVLSSNFILYITLISAGWVLMVTGQSLVLYSRLHLIFWNQFCLKLVLAMIITDAIVLHIPIIILMYGANSSDANPWVQPYQIYEKIQVTMFFLQELVISAIYIKTCSSFFGTEGFLYRQDVRRMRKHLLLVNVLIILLDIPILVLEFMDFYTLQTAYKAIVYSIKLKLEFDLLNRLVEVAKGNDALDPYSGNRIVTNMRASIFEQDRVGSGGVNDGYDSVEMIIGHKRRPRRDAGLDDGGLIDTGIVVSYVERREDDVESMGRRMSI